jgi:phospholipid transport system substrate-binding protein
VLGERKERKTAMISKTEQNKWRTGEVVGALTCNDRRQREGNLDPVKGNVIGTAARAVSKIKHVVISVAMKAILLARFVLMSVLLLLCCLALPAASRAGSPTEQVRATVDKVLTIVRSPNPKSKPQMDEQRAKLIEVIYPRFDFPEMAKRSLGPNWARRTPEEQREFVGIFAALMGRAYAENIESYTSQNVLYTRESEDQNYAQVDTKIVSDNQPPLTINYKLRRVDQEWKVYDLVIEDISVVNNYRSQFNRVIARSSFAELVRTMKEKQP